MILNVRQTAVWWLLLNFSERRKICTPNAGLFYLGFLQWCYDIYLWWSSHVLTLPWPTHDCTKKIERSADGLEKKSPQCCDATDKTPIILSSRETVAGSLYSILYSLLAENFASCCSSSMPCEKIALSSSALSSLDGSNWVSAVVPPGTACKFSELHALRRSSAFILKLGWSLLGLELIIKRQ